MDEVRWGIIGFGEAGSMFARQISGRFGKPVRVTDELLNRVPPPTHIRQRLAGIDVEIAPDVPQLLSECDAVLSLVTPGAASAVAAEAAGAWRGGLLIDLNSVSPLAKCRMAALFPEGGFVDGAILGSVAGEGPGAPLALAGPCAGKAQALLEAAGFSSTVVGAAVGGASAVKMCRSIFMKGIECLLVETLLAAGQYGVAESVLDSIEGTFDAYGVRPMVKMLVTTHAAHCCRRSDEMRLVVNMLKELGLPSGMSEAGHLLLRNSSDLGLTAHFSSKVPERPEDVIQFLMRSYQEKNECHR